MRSPTARRLKPLPRNPRALRCLAARLVKGGTVLWGAGDAAAPDWYNDPHIAEAVSRQMSSITLFHFPGLPPSSNTADILSRNWPASPVTALGAVLLALLILAFLLREAIYRVLCAVGLPQAFDARSHALDRTLIPLPLVVGTLLGDFAFQNIWLAVGTGAVFVGVCFGVALQAAATFSDAAEAQAQLTGGRSRQKKRVGK